MKSVLIIDDSDEVRETLAAMLADEYLVCEASCPDDAYKILQREGEKFDVIVCDLHMPFTFGERFHEYPYSFQVGIKTIQELGWVFPGTPVIGMSAAAPSDIAKMRKALGDIPFLSKPFSAADLVEVIEEASTAALQGIVQ